MVFTLSIVFLVIRCDVKSDVGILLDSSGSVKVRGYQQEKDFIKKIVGAFQLGEDKSRASVVTFSHLARLSIKFNQFYDQTSFDNAVDKIPYLGSWTRIDAALRLAKSEMFKGSNGARRDVPNTLILLTDGAQNANGATDEEDPAKVAQELRNSGVTIIAVGITDAPNERELEKITGSPDNVFTASNFDTLISDDFVRKLQVKTCNTGEYFNNLPRKINFIGNVRFKLVVKNRRKKINL